MQTRTLFLFGVLFCLFAVTSAGGGKGKMEKMSKCHDDKINTEEAFKGMKECKEKAKAEEKTEEERRRRRSPGGGGGGKGRGNMCVPVCAWKEQGILDKSTGQFDEEGAKKHVDSVYPEKYRADAFEKIKKCADDNSSKFSMDEKCKGYKDFKKCSMKAHMDTCGIEMGKNKKKPKEEEE